MDLSVDVRIRPMVLADLNTVFAIERDVMVLGWSRKNFIDCINGPYDCCVVVDDDVIVGYFILSKVVDECHLINIAVNEACQNRGLGGYMLNEIKARCLQNNIVLMLLEVRQSNRKAQDFYRYHGFYENGVRKNYYPAKQGREDAVLMVCPLR